MVLSKKDINGYITVINANFHDAYVWKSAEDLMVLINSWYSILREYPKEIVDEACRRALKKAKYPVRIGDVVDEIEQMVAGDTPQELWNEVEEMLPVLARIDRVLMNPSHRDYDEALKGLNEIWDEIPNEIKRYFGTKKTLRSLTRMDTEVLNYEKARFLKGIGEIKTQIKNEVIKNGQLQLSSNNGDTV